MSADPVTTDLASLSPEETKQMAKAEKKEAARAKKLEKKLLKAKQEKDALLQDRRDEFGRELEFTGKTYDKHADNWEKMLVDIKQDSMRKEVEGLFADVSQMLDRKQNLVERLTADRTVAQEQAKFNISSHKDFLDYSKFTFHSFAKALRDMYQTQVDIDLSSFRKQCLDQSLVACRRKNFFENLLLGSNNLVDEHLLQLNVKFDEEKENFVNSDIERRETIRDNTQRSMERLYSQMKKIVDTVRRTSMSKERIKEYTRLVKRNKQDANGFAKTQKRMEEAVMQISKLHHDRHRLEVMSMNDLIEMKKEKEYFMKCFALLRDRYELDMSNDQKLMRCLMDKTYSATTVLKELEKRGGLILGVSNVVRKLQTEKEKVLPFPVNHKEEGKDEDLDHISQMESFWTKVSAVSAQNMELIAEKRSLELDNQRLRETIKRYCTQDKYERCIRTLKISKKPTVVLPTQEAAHMVQLKRFSKAK